MKTNTKKTIIIILGPTAVGKTNLCINIAQRLNTEILYADSRQIYQDMHICTAQPTMEEMKGVKHHFLNFLPPTELYSAATYATEVLAFLEGLFKKTDSVILSGGTGLYIDAVCRGLDQMPSINYDLRESLNLKLENEGLVSLQHELQLRDPEYYEIVDKKNARRIIRALEVIYTTGKKYSDHTTQSIAKRPFNIIKIGLNRDKEELYNRINLRVDIMKDGGLIEEARKNYPLRDLNSMQTIGYRELFDFFEDKITLEEAIWEIKKNTRHYAKRQLTWFKKDQAITWYHPDDLEKIVSDIENILSKIKNKF